MNRTVKVNPAKFLPLLASVIAITPLAIDMYLPAMTSIASDLNVSISALQQTLSVYLIGYAVGMALFGPVADHFGRKRLLLIGLCGFSLCSFLLSQTSTLSALLILRFCQALCGGAASVVIPATVRLLYDKNTAKGMSYVSMTMMIAPLIAPALGSAILSIASWPFIFLFITGYALLILLAVTLYFPKLANKEEQAARAQPFHWLKILSSNYKIVLGNKHIYRYLAISMLSSLIFFTYLTAIPFIYMTVFKLGQNQFSLFFGLNVIGLMSGNFLNARLVGQLGSKSMMRLALSVAMISAFILLASMIAGNGVYWCVATIIPIMACIMILINNADAMVLLQFREQAATASAVLGSLRFGSGSAAGLILALSYNGGPVPFAAIIFSILVLIALVLIGVKPTSTD